MPKPPEEVLEFQCPKCSKKLKAGPSFAGRRVKCPGCSQAVTVPGVLVNDQRSSVPPKATAPSAGPIAPPPLIESAKKAEPLDDLWLSLDVPAIDDVQERETAAADAKAKKAAAAQAMKNRVRNESTPNDVVSPPPVIATCRPSGEKATAHGAVPGGCTCCGDE